MSRFRKVDPKMWGDAKFRALSPPPPCGQSLFQYLLTGPETTSLPGVLRGGQAHFAEELGWTVEGFAKAFAEVFHEGLAKADWRARMVWLPNAKKYNVPESPNVVRSWRTAWDEVPECDLKLEAYHALRAFTEGLGEGFAKAFTEACAKPSPKALANQEQEQEQEQEQDPNPVEFATPPTGVVEKRGARSNGGDSAHTVSVTPVEQVFDYWRSKLMPRAKLDDKRKVIIGAALKTYTVEELCKAVDGTLLDPHRMGENEKGRKYVGCELVFRNAEKIDPMIALADEAVSDEPPADWIPEPDPINDPPGTQYITEVPKEFSDLVTKITNAHRDDP